MWLLFVLSFLTMVAVGGFIVLRFVIRTGNALLINSGLIQAPFFSSIHFESQSTFLKPMPLALTTTRKILLVLGAILFDVLFWDQLQGVNLLLWTVFVVVVVGVTDDAAARRSPAWRAVALGALLAAAGTAYYGSGVAELATWVSLGLLVGFANQPQVRLLSNAFLTGVANGWRVLGALLGALRTVRLVSGPLRRAWYYGRLLLVPGVLLLIFHVLFIAANPRYALLVGNVGAWLAKQLEWLFKRLSVPHVLFFLFGSVVTAGLLLRVAVPWFSAWEVGRSEFIQRLRRPRQRRLPTAYAPLTTSPIALRKEYLAALAALVLVNGLLLVVNVIDVQWLWFGFEPGPKFDLAQFVHEGTYVLILSILLAMAIVLYFFRRNLNFYARAARRLRPLATVWVVQNAVLAVSVGLRNYYYISHMGLAYKRVGVYAFLLLTLFGLLTVLLKIWQRRSAFALVRLNAWAVYGVVLLLALGNWEIWIARFNLQPRFAASLDEEFLLDMPPRVLPELLQHVEAFRKPLGPGLPLGSTILGDHVGEFLKEYPQRDWQSWTYADARAYEEVKALAPAVKAQLQP